MGMPIYKRICSSVRHAICHASYESVKGQADFLYENAFVVYFQNGNIIKVYFYSDGNIICFDTKKQKTVCTLNYSLNDDVDGIADRIVNKLNP